VTAVDDYTAVPAAEVASDTHVSDTESNAFGASVVVRIIKQCLSKSETEARRIRAAALSGGRRTDDGGAV
jgi:formate-dependent phosphoribosylglycinamide formyltransferase (GAR transformylase)